MSYCTLKDILEAVSEDNVIQLTDDEGLGVLNQERVDKAITTAGSIIDGYLGGRYTLPLLTVPVLIKTIAVDIAVYKLYERRFELNMPEAMSNRYKNAIKLLEQIQKGLIRLGIEPPKTEHGYYKTNKTSEDRIFKKAV